MPTADRILTTHNGSFARPEALRALLGSVAEHKQDYDTKLQTMIRDAVFAVVKRQVEAGLDIINDGEQSRTSFAAYVGERLTGFDGPTVTRVESLESRQFAGLMGRSTLRPCTGPLGWKDFALVERDVQNLKDATAGLKDKQMFMSSVSPGTFINLNPNAYYKSREEYLATVIGVMKREYRAILDAGFILQLDSPDLASQSVNFPDLAFSEWRKILAENVEALNAAIADLPRERVRVHVCWGANNGPHNHDAELKNIVDILVGLKSSAMSIVAGNARHQHEWKVWKTNKLPESMKLVVGVIDSTTNIVEHPEVVADRLVHFGEVLGRDRIVAGVDCGFGTSGTGKPTVHPEVVWTKLASLAEGARRASDRLWGRAAA